jgi:hypothetical protein
MKGAMKDLAPYLSGPLAAGDMKALNNAIDRALADMSDKGCPLVPAVGVADKSGVLVGGDETIFPFTTQNYSNISAVEQALREGKTAQTRLFTQNEKDGYLLCTPLIVNKETVGVLLLFFPDDVITGKYGLSEREFLMLNFNR